MDENKQRPKPIDLENHVLELEEEENYTEVSDAYKEETAAELVDHDVEDLDYEQDEEDRDIKSVYGWSAIALSVISFFILPFIFAGLGIVVGFVARVNRAPILGNTAIVIGALSILVKLFILPLI